MARTTGTPAATRPSNASSGVPRAAEMMSPATPCSRISLMTSAWRTGLSAVLAMKGT